MYLKLLSFQKTSLAAAGVKSWVAHNDVKSWVVHNDIKSWVKLVSLHVSFLSFLRILSLKQCVPARNLIQHMTHLQLPSYLTTKIQSLILLLYPA